MCIYIYIFNGLNPPPYWGFDTECASPPMPLYNMHAVTNHWGLEKHHPKLGMENIPGFTTKKHRCSQEK